MTDVSHDNSGDLATHFQDAINRMDVADVGTSAALDALRLQHAKGQNTANACAMFRANADALHHEAITIRELGNAPNLIKNSFVEDGVFRAGVILATERIDNEEAENICRPQPSSKAPPLTPSR